MRIYRRSPSTAKQAGTAPVRLNTLLLPYPSLTVNKDDLVERVSTLPSAWLGKVEDGLRWFLHLDLAEP